LSTTFRAAPIACYKSWCVSRGVCSLETRKEGQ
jgi:hypothetical protein